MLGNCISSKVLSKDEVISRIGSPARTELHITVYSGFSVTLWGENILLKIVSFCVIENVQLFASCFRKRR